MLHAIRKVEYLKDYKLKLTFRNKDVKVVDLEKELWGQMFEPLKDIEYFKKVKTDGYTILWPNGLDLCPDTLHESGIDIQKSAKPPVRRRAKQTTHALSKKAPKKTKR